MDDFSEDFFDIYHDKSDAEREEITEFEVYKPLAIRNAIKSKDILELKEILFIYSSGVDVAISNMYIKPFRPLGLNDLFDFLNLAIKSRDFDILDIVWKYGIEPYFKSHLKFWPEILYFISDLIHDNMDVDILKFLISKIEIDDKVIDIKTDDTQNEFSGTRREYVVGNLLEAAVYYNNINAIKILLPIQPKDKNKDLRDYLESTGKDIVDIATLNTSQNSFFDYDYYSRNTLCSNDSTLYGFDKGNIEAIHILIEDGYEINFKALDFTYQLVNFAHIDTIKYLYNNYPEEFKNLNVDVILKSTNYILLKIILDNNIPIGKNALNQIITHDRDLYEFIGNRYGFIRSKNIEKCLRLLVNKGLKFENIQVTLPYGFEDKNYTFLDMCISLYDSNAPMDITPIIHDLVLEKDMLKYLSERIKLSCKANEVNKLSDLGIRYFSLLLTIIDFNIEDSNRINNITKGILDLNAVTSIQLLYSEKFITKQNYSDAVDYIVEEGLDKLLPRVISLFSSIGGLEKEYEI